MRIRNTMDLALLIRSARRRRGWSQSALAGQVGVSRNWVVAMEAGRPGAEVGLVLQAMRVLDLHLFVRPGGPVDRGPAPLGDVPPTVGPIDEGPRLTRNGRPLGESRGREQNGSAAIQDRPGKRQTSEDT